MTRWMFALALSFVCAPALAKKPLTPEASLEVRWPGAPALSPDGRWVAFAITDKHPTKPSDTQLYLMPAHDGAPRAITRSGGHSPTWSPDGRRLAFVGASNGEAALMVFEVGQVGEPTVLFTFAPGIAEPRFTADGRFIVFVGQIDPACRDAECHAAAEKKKADDPVKARVYDDLLYRHWSGWDDGTRAHLFVVPVDKSAAPKDLTPGPLAVPTDILNAGTGWTLTKDSVVFARHQGEDRARSTNNDLYEKRLFAGRPVKLTDNPAWDANPVASPSGRYVAYTAFARPGFEADRPVLHIYDRETKKTVARTRDWDRGVRDIVWSGEDALFVTAYDRGFKALFRLPRVSGAPERVVGDRSVKYPAAGPSGEVVFVATTFEAPPEVWQWDPRTKKASAITSLNRGFVEHYRLGAAQEKVATANDGTKVHGFVLTPPGFDPRRRYPLFVLIHGGPQGAWISQWHPRWNPQLFAAEGYVVAMPNPRGSVGYGQAYVDAVTKNWGGGPYADVLAYTDAVEANKYIKPKATCAGGASYGGYLVNWIAGHTDRFACLISHAGVYNLESFWGDTEELWFPEWEFGGPPHRSRDLYDKWSPHRFIDDAKTPTLVIHGQLDYRVHLSQGQQMFTALRTQGVPARFLYFPDEGHWVLKSPNYVFWYGQMFRWLDKYL